MADRDKDLTGLFVRDLDEIPLPARAAWRGSRKGNTAMRASRLLLTAGAVVAVLAIALIAGNQLNERQQGVVVGSPLPSTSQATSGPSGKPTGTTCPQPNTSCGATGSTAPTTTGTYNDDFGFFMLDGGGSASIRKESSAARIASFTGQGFAISPDGRQVAFWAAGSASNGQQLQVVAASDPTRVQTLVTLAAAERGGGIAWASDGLGVLYATRGSVGQRPAASLHAFDGSASTRDRLISSLADGSYFFPIAWDRSTDTIAAASHVAPDLQTIGQMSEYMVVSGGGGSFYTTGRSYPLELVHASTDARFIVAGDPSGVYWWPIRDYKANRPVGEFLGPCIAFWRPSTHEIACEVRSEILLYDVDRTLVTRTIPGGIGNLGGVRADGSAVIAAPPHGGPGTTTYIISQLSDGGAIGLQDTGALLGSVRLR